METIQNDTLRIAVKPSGAELCSIQALATGKEYMWEGNPAIWGSFAPVLFPIVGTLKDNTYLYNGKSYQLFRHGFFRGNDKVTLVKKTENQLAFSLKSDAESLKVYPFEFEMVIAFTLEGKSVHISHEVRNTGNETMFFSVGGHPAFKCPLNEGETYEDYYLHFDQKENATTWDLNSGGIITQKGRVVLDNSDQLPLDRHLFDHDALIFKHLRSASVSLNHYLNGPVLEVDFNGWPYLGIWAKPQAPYVCIEPWLGIADSVDTDQQIENKEGILSLLPGKTFMATFSIKIMNLEE
ncbi:MAG: aldose 1-epimerase family protein [Bacteroidia bacterium]